MSWISTVRLLEYFGFPLNEDTYEDSALYADTDNETDDALDYYTEDEYRVSESDAEDRDGLHWETGKLEITDWCYMVEPARSQPLSM